MMRQVSLWTLCSAMLIATIGSANAQITSVSGQVLALLFPPPSVATGALENDVYGVVFQEQSNLVLSAPLTVNAQGPGTYDINNASSSLVIPTGTPIQSYFVHFDSVGMPNRYISYTCTITFATNILGVIYMENELNASDAPLGAPGTTYATNEVWRGFEGNFDSITISNDLKTVTINSRLLNHLDQIRIITDVVPEPSSLLVLAAGLPLLARLRRR